MNINRARWFKRLRWGAVMGAMVWSTAGAAQDASSSSVPPDAVRELRDQIRELQQAVAGMRSDWERARAETAELRRELAEVRAGTAHGDRVLTSAIEPHSGGSSEYMGRSQNARSDRALGEEEPENSKVQIKGERPATLEEEYQLLNGKVDDQYQTKVESASKYHLRLSGIVLMNLVSNQGVVDSVDLPTLAYARRVGDSGGSFAATLRQSEVGLEAFGPNLLGARTSADLQLDLAGGFPSVPNGINSGLLRLRTGTIHLDWANTSVVAGQDAIFFSPGSPSSFASLAVPALSAAGNLWAWAPQIRVEHRVTLGNDSSLVFQGGILDPVSGEAPGTGSYRQAGPGESSRQPSYASRIAFARNLFGQPLRLGMGGFYSRQDYGYSRAVDAWAAMTDIELPLGHQFSLTGKLYRGRGLGGLYSAAGRSAVYSGDPTEESTLIRGLNSAGGWAQLKYRPATKLEFNAAFGMDNPYASDLKLFPYATYWNAPLTRNQGSFVNVIYRPRSDLLFSAEYRHLTTYDITDGGNSAGHLNLMLGVLF